ncbi:MAG: response regulator [Chloroflexaceae bacterium]|nr:response regulator [Chloroflexaceae bacterium]
MAHHTVLIVEDDDSIRLSLMTLVRGCGFDVLTAANGEEAIVALTSARVDIVLTDLMMPRLDGYSLIRWMHANDRNQPVVVLSAQNTYENTIKALRLGAYDYIAKPFKLEDVEASLRRAEVVIARRQADTALHQRNRELAALNAISAAVNSSLELDEMLTLALQGGLVYMVGNGERLHQHRTYGELDALLPLLPHSTAQPAEPCTAIGVVEVTQLIGSPALLELASNTALAAVALPVNGVVGGLLLLVGSSPTALNREQLALLESIGNYIGVGISNTRLYRQVRDSAALLEELVQQRTRELQRSRDLLRTIFDGIPSGLLMADSDGRVLATNRSYARLLGMQPQRLIDQNYGQIWRNANSEGAATLLERCMSSGEAVNQRERLERRNARPVVLDHYLFPVHDGDGNIAQVIAYVEDVTERLALERVLAQSEQLAALGKLAANVAHELNTPLLAIRGCLSLIGNPKVDAATRSEYQAMAESELERAAGIIHGMLEFYRSEGKDRVTTDLNSLIKKTTHLLRAECAKHNINVELNLDPLLPAIVAAPDQMKQVVLGLLMNAITALSQGGRITIQTQFVAPDGQMSTLQQQVPQKPYVLLSTQDTRSELPQKLRSLVFDDLVATNADSVSLGLAMMQTIIREHAGTINLEPIQGGGARFTVALPAVADVQGQYQRRAAGVGR